MKLKGLSLILPVADARPLCASASRFDFLSPHIAKPGKTRLKGFGVAGDRNFRIPWRSHETIYFPCDGAISLPRDLPDGAGVTRNVRRVYLDADAAIRFDLSVFTNPRHSEPQSLGNVADWVRAFWNTPLDLHDRGTPDPVPCPTAFELLAQKLIASSSPRSCVRDDLVEVLPPLLIVIVQAENSELQAPFLPLDAGETLFAWVRRLPLPRFNEEVATVCIAHTAGRYLQASQSDFKSLRMARLIPAWLHTDLQVALSLTRRAHSTKADRDLILPYLKDLVGSLALVSNAAGRAGLSIGAFKDLYENAAALLVESLNRLGIQTVRFDAMIAGGNFRMRDERQWALALARFDALRRNKPSWIKQRQVDEYHSILDALQAASGEALSSFRIPDSDLKPQPGSRYRPTITRYSDDLYCDDTFFTRQIEGLWNYIRTLKASKPKESHMDAQTDYWSMDDVELEKIAIKYNIPPISRAGKQGEHWYIDRDRIIDALVKRDAALRAGKPAPAPGNVVNVETMYGSSIQQGTERSTVTINFRSNDPDLRRVLDKIKNSMDKIELSQSAKDQLASDIGTVEAQLSAPHPRPSIIIECLHSMRSIFEGMVGSLIASGLVHEITKLLGSR